MRSLQDKVKKNQLLKAIQELEIDEESVISLPTKYKNALVGDKSNETGQLNLERLYSKYMPLISPM